MKNVLITGASSGFGYEMSKLFSKKGFNVIAVARREDRLLKLQKKCKNIYPIVLDVGDKKAVFKAFSNLPFEKIDILINNAGLALGLDLSNDALIEDWEEMVRVNVNGMLYVTKAILPLMVKAKSGYIFNIGSIAGTYPYQGGNVYGASKAFMRQFSLNLRTDLKGTNIRVTNIEPGLVKTDFSITRFKGDIKRANSVYENHQCLTAKDIAKIVYFCAKSPKRVNINALEVMPTSQTSNGLFVETLQ